MFQSLTQIVKKSLSLNDSKRKRTQSIRSKLITKSEGCKVKMEECKANSKGQ